jgi:hypothetical protein
MITSDRSMPCRLAQMVTGWLRAVEMGGFTCTMLSYVTWLSSCFSCLVIPVQAQEKRWSWFAGPDRPGVFEIDWQEHQGINRIAIALECRQVAVIDVTKIAALNYGNPI